MVGGVIFPPLIQIICDANEVNLTINNSDDAQYTQQSAESCSLSHIKISDA